MRIKLTPEEKNAKQKAANKVYRDNMTPEQKAKVAAQKKEQNILNKEKNTERRKLYYEINKEHMKANSKAYHQKIRDEIKAKREAGMDIPKVIYAPRVRKPKVVNQPANTIILKDIAKSVGMLTPQFRGMINEPKYKFPDPAMVRIDGMDLYDVFEITEWIHLHKEALTQASILGARRRDTGEFELASHVMLIINWLQASKHVTDYCNKQRVAINSNQFWARYA
jgi:predicted DNA-binding transcriptional regulator AlpA